MAHLADESWTTPKSVKQDMQASHDMTVKLGSLGKNSGTGCSPQLPARLLAPVNGSLVSSHGYSFVSVPLIAIYAGANFGNHDNDTYQDDDRDDAD